MSPVDPPPDHVLSDLRGASRLTVDAIVGIVDLVESMHRTVLTGGGLWAENRERLGGPAGLVFSHVRTATELVGGSLDAALAPLVALLDETEPSPAREAVVAAVNGVVGDHLAATDNPLATPMQLRRDGKPMRPDASDLGEAIEQADGRVLLLVHGSCANDRQWERNGHDHGAALAEDLGYLPVYLRYNSGRHISHNGRDLAELLERFLAQLPETIDLTILGHSMGGLVARSACRYADHLEMHWREQLEALVCLGTPHHGTLLEQTGNWVEHLLQISPYSAPFARLGKIRSAGVTDLRYGNLLDEDWQGRGRFELGTDERTPVPLPADVDCYTLAATQGDSPDGLADRIVGDGLVPVDSALGRHDNPTRQLGFPETHRRVARGLSHLDLLDDPEVYDVLEEWLSPSVTVG